MNRKIMGLCAAFAVLTGCTASDGTLQAELDMTFNYVDEEPYIPYGNYPLKQWEDETGKCVITFNDSVKPLIVAVGTLDGLRKYVEKFQLPRAVPVRCEDKDEAREAAMHAKGYSNVESFSLNSMTPDEFFQGKREEVKRKVNDFIQKNRTAINSVGRYRNSH